MASNGDLFGTLRNIEVIRFFCTDLNNYIYDGSTNNILNVSNELRNAIHEIKSDGHIRHSPQLFAALKASFEKRKIFLFNKFPPINPPYSLDGIKRQLESNVRQLTLRVTNDCNLRCDYCSYSGCYRTQKPHSSSQMTFDVARSSIDFFHDVSTNAVGKAITFYGGEPLLQFHLIKRSIEYAKNKFTNRLPIFNLTTNGTLINETMVRFFRNNKVYIMISLDGPQIVHDKYRKYPNGQGTFCKITRNIDSIRNFDLNYYDQFVSFNVVLRGPANLCQIHDYFNDDAFSKNRIQVSGVERAFIEDSPKNEWLSEPVIGWQNMRMKFKESLGSSNAFLRGLYEPNLVLSHKRNLAKIQGDYHYPNSTCLPGERKILVDNLGDFHICEKTADNVIIGNISCGFDFSKIEFIVSNYCSSCSDCESCWAARLCTQCFSSCLTETGIDIAEKKKNCKGVKLMIEDTLMLYCEILESDINSLDYFNDLDLT